ncbi:MAG: hypothetical protein B5M56_08550 [Desulfococcus sp. 4484_241]|nr:MAG: hypothetical protein B5M56_08550 [Desulfococcus sp. 4484_241]
MADFYKVDSSASRKRPVGMRKSRRFMVKDADIELARTGILNLLWKNKPKVSVVNISKEGIQIMLTTEIKPDDRFRVNLRLPGLRNTFEVKAKVIWCHFYKTVFNKKYYRAGLQFTDPSPQVNVCIRTLEKTA